MRSTALAAALAIACAGPSLAGAGPSAEMREMISRHAQANGVPESLVHRVIVRESRYNPRASRAGNYGLMQIRHQTAHGVGYQGTASGLLDPETNLTYGVKYLAGAWRVSGGNQNRAIRYYSSGYYYAAKRHHGHTMVASRSAPSRNVVMEATALPTE